ncbi:NUDIX domain-containing protein [Streptomyces anulatus]|uniref:NUDIX domain-containing protein n=1 Tax=Streptomyces anulatus TaxID=1892 RepID=UPI001C27BA3E|nr:NUDIX hydrolase [Streptomyces anulatus]
MGHNEGRSRVSAGAVIRDEHGRVLIVDPVYKPYWNLPGGAAEENEVPRETCRREVLEELNLDLDIGRLLVHATIAVADGAPRDYFIFDGGVLSARRQQDIRLQQSELGAFRFAAPGDLTDKDIAPFARQMWDSALLALSESRTIRIGER